MYNSSMPELHLANRTADILAVDDDAGLLELLKALLYGRGYSVRTAASGEAALKQARAKTPDLVLLDLMLPGMGGYEVLQALKSASSLKDVPVIILSAVTAQDDRIKGLNLGAADYVLKPFDRYELLARVKLHLDLAALRDDTRRLVLELAAERDNLKTRLVEERARALELERLRAAVEQAQDAIVITDAAVLITYANPAFEKLTGYPLAEATGKNPRFLKSGIQDEAFYIKLWDELLAGHTWRGRIVNKRKNGTIYTESLLISAITEQGGRITGFVAVKRDITNELLLERQFLEAQKMETIGLLTGGIAHDFNNVLGAIKGYASLLATTLSQDNPWAEDILEILKAAERGTALTKQLLAFSRRQVLNPQVTDLGRIATDFSRMLRRLLPANVNFSVKAGAQCNALVDAGQIEQVLSNLILNAKDALSPGGSITVEVATLPETPPDLAGRRGIPAAPLVRLAVRDDGCGMPPEVLARVFDPFFTTKPNGKGTGLGLAVVHGIVEQSGGYVRGLSEPGKGSIFEIFLPLVRQEAEAAPPVAAEMMSARGNETILLAEDDEQMRTFCISTLKKLGYKVIGSASGEEALATGQTLAQPPALLLTDVVMPGMSGRELGARLHAQKLAPRVLYMSGYADSDVIRHGKLEPGLALLQKPFSALELGARVRQILDGPAEKARP